MKRLLSFILVCFLVLNSSFGSVAATKEAVTSENISEVAVNGEQETDTTQDATQEEETTEDAMEETSEIQASEEIVTEVEITTEEEITEEIIRTESEDSSFIEAAAEGLDTAMVTNTIDEKNGTYKVILDKNSLNAAYDIYRVAVWSEKNGQDDLIWYPLKASSDGNYAALVSLLDHFGESGSYNVHAYGCVNGKPVKCVAKTTFTANPMKKNYITVNPNGSKKIYTVQLNNFVLPDVNCDNITKIYVPTWTKKNEQDDIVWGVATKVNAHTWKYDVDITEHKFEVGEYISHIYASVNGELKYVSEKSFQVEGMNCSNATISISDVNANEGKYRITTGGFSSTTRIVSVRAAVWSENNGKDDLKWQTLSTNGNGTYSCDVDITEHNYDVGTYVALIYAKDARGVEQYIIAKKWDVKKIDKNVVRVRLSENQSQITVSLLNASGNISHVRFAVWCERNGKNDMIWYQATKVDGKTWTVDVPVSNHKEAGRYQILCYKVVNGVQSFVGNKTCKVDGFTGTVTVSTRTNNKGYIKLTATGIKSPAGMKTVKAAVWTEKNGKDDLRWYTLSKVEGIWTCVIDASYHNGEKGNYCVQVWGCDKRNIAQALKNASATVTEINAMPIAIARTLSDEISVQLDAKGIVGATSVSFAVWGDVDGQNDAYWYNGERVDGRHWKATADMMNHLEIGLYNVHVYAVINGKNKFVCATSFNYTGNPVELRLRRDCENVYNMVGRDLKACFDYVVNSMTYERINGHLTPPEGWTRCQNYAVKALETHRGNCYCYAAAFYYLAKFLGYNVEYVEGQVPSRRGGYTPHGWVVVDGAYICDPEAQAEIARNLNFYMMPIGRTPFTYLR